MELPMNGLKKQKPTPRRTAVRIGRQQGMNEAVYVMLSQMLDALRE